MADFERIWKAPGGGGSVGDTPDGRPAFIRYRYRYGEKPEPLADRFAQEGELAYPKTWEELVATPTGWKPASEVLDPEVVAAREQLLRLLHHPYWGGEKGVLVKHVFEGRNLRTREPEDVVTHGGGEFPTHDAERRVMGDPRYVALLGGEGELLGFCRQAANSNNFSLYFVSPNERLRSLWASVRYEGHPYPTEG